MLRLQCGLRRSVNQLYHGYLESILRDLQPHERSGDVSQAIASLPALQSRTKSACTKPREPKTVQLKLLGDHGCARVREQLWRLQHMPYDLAASGHR